MDMEVRLIVLMTTFAFGLLWSHWFVVRPYRAHTRWLNHRLQEEHDSRMKLYDRLDPQPAR